MDLEAVLYKKYLAALSLHRFVQSDSFVYAKSLANDFELATLYSIIDELDKEAAIVWVKNIFIKHKKYDFLDVRTLKNLCSMRKIQYDSSSVRYVLTQCLVERDNEQSQSQSRADGNQINGTATGETAIREEQNGEDQISEAEEASGESVREQEGTADVHGVEEEPAKRAV